MTPAKTMVVKRRKAS
jgi:hypothetical protein